MDPKAEKYFNFSTYNYVANNPIIAKDPDGKDIIFVVGDTRYTYRKGNLYLNNKQVWTPYTDGKYHFLSSNQQSVLDQFRYMENSGDKIFKGVLSTLIASRNRHEIRQGDQSTTGVVPFGQWSQDAYEEYSSGRGSNSYSEFNFNTTRKQGYSDLETVFHEMRHMLDIDKGRLPADTKFAEMNAVAIQNYVRRKEGKGDRKEYETKKSTYYYTNEDMRKSFDGLLKLIERALNENSNGFTIYFN